MKWLNTIPTHLLLGAAVLFGLAPFFPEPHLVEKLRLLFDGQLRKPIDIFDLFLHILPTLLLAYKVILLRKNNKSSHKN